MYDNYHKRLETAIELRETGQLTLSRREFESLIAELEPTLKNSTNKTDKFFYATLMGEYVIQHRLEGKALFNKALELGKQLLDYDEKNAISNPLSIRSVSNTLIDLGNYESAILYLTKLLPLYTENSALYGDTLAHIARCHYSSGNIKDAEEFIERAIKEIETNSANVQDTTAWFSHALLLKALILSRNNDKDTALQLANQALQVAQSKNKVMRIKQAQMIIDHIRRTG